MSQALPETIDTPELPDDDMLVVAPRDDYWSLSREPLTSLVFSFPLLLLYEVGVLLQSPTDPRNGAEVWLRDGLAAIGLGRHYFLLPLLVTGLMLAWHHLSGLPWRVNRRVLPGMCIESIVLAIGLLFVAKSQMRWFPLELNADNPFSHSLVLAQHQQIGVLARLIGYFGAGFYEEVLFRLILFPITALILHKVGLRAATSWTLALILSSLFFAAAHHMGSGGEVWAIRPFVFRFVAGALFCMLFLKRGFGITAWSHAIYDIIVGIL